MEDNGRVRRLWVTGKLQLSSVKHKLHETRVNNLIMKNITFTADESLIEKARKKARRENSSLNKRFREWLKHYATDDLSKEKYKDLMQKLDYAKPGRKFTRDEMNER